MRVAHLLATLIAVLAVVLLPGCGALDNSSYSVRRAVRSLPPHPINHWEQEDNPETRRTRSWLTTREMQAVVRREGGEAGAPVDCCPSVLEMVEPAGGKNQEDMYVELYRDGDNRQRFYELSCRGDVENKPCRFVDRKLYNQSKCIQKFSYTYALVRDVNANDQHHQRHQRKQRQFPALPAGGWMLDYIRVRSGCACELRARKRHKKPPERRSHPKLDHASSTRESSPET